LFVAITYAYATHGLRRYAAILLLPLRQMFTPLPFRYRVFAMPWPMMPYLCRDITPHYAVTHYYDIGGRAVLNNRDMLMPDAIEAITPIVTMADMIIAIKILLSFA